MFGVIRSICEYQTYTGQDAHSRGLCCCRTTRDTAGAKQAENIGDRTSGLRKTATAVEGSQGGRHPAAPLLLTCQQWGQRCLHDSANQTFLQWARGCSKEHVTHSISPPKPSLLRLKSIVSPSPSQTNHLAKTVRDYLDEAT